MNILTTLTVCEIAPDWCDDPDPVTGPDPDQQLRDKNPGLQEAYDTYMEAKDKYDMLYKLLKTTESFR